MSQRAKAALVAAPVAAYLLASLLLPKGVPVEVLIPGAVNGMLSALTAMALVLVFRSSRVVNFAQANIGGFCATLVVLLVGVQHLSYWLAVPLGLGVAVLIGAFVERGPLGAFREAPRLIVTVATIGIAQLFGALTLFISGNTFSVFGWTVPNPFDVPEAAGAVVPFRLPSGWRLEVGSLVLTSDYLAALVAVPLVLGGLTWFFQRTDAGIGTRAAADSSERALLLGIPVRRLSLITWVVASFLSALGAILAAGVAGFQSNVPVGPESLIIPLVAAVVAGFDSLVMAFVASIVLGLVQATITWNYGDLSLVDLVMFVLILAAMALRKRSATRVGGGDVEGFTGVGEIRPLPAALAELPVVRRGKVIGLVVLVALATVVPLGLSGSTLTFLAFTSVFVVIGASLTLLAGWGGQVSLGHFGIVGLGAGTTGWLLVVHQVPFLLCMVAAGGLGTLAALVIGVPALRIRGIYLAVATLAFAAPASTYVLNTARFPALTQSRIDPPLLLGRYDLSQARPFYYFCLLIALGALGMLRNFRRSRIGRATIAVRDNERFAAAASISSTRVRLSAFALSGALAGVAGSLYALALRGIPVGGFAPVLSLSVFTMVVVGGLGSAWGAVLGAVYIYGSQILLGPTAQLLTQGLGLLLVLQFAPGGLASLAYSLRDLVLARLVPDNALFDRAEDGSLAPVAEVPTQTRGGLLQLEGIEAGYGHLQILFGITAGVDDGDVFALLGTNGAGKSTVLKVVAGLLPERGGRVVFDGEDLTGLTPTQRVERGLVLVPGGRGIFPGLTVEENLRLGGWIARRRGDTAFLEQTTERIYALFPVLRERRTQKAGLLSGGEQQMLTIGQALLCKPRLLMIDELSLGLAPAVVGQLLEVVRQLSTEGITIVIVEQSMNVAAALAPKAIFLEKGQLRFAGATSQLASTETLVRSVFFAEDREATAPAEVGEERVLQVRGLAKSYGGVRAVDGVDLELRSHEILGVIGANGAGKTTLFDLICGFTPADRGSVLLHGEVVSSRPSFARFARGLGRTFQDLRLVPSLTVLETIAVALERHIDVREPVAATLGLPAALLSEQSVREQASELVEAFNLQRYANSFVSELSTGTRRVVELAAATAHRPSVLILDEPSSGLAQKEAEAMVPLLLETRHRLGCAIAIIEHDIPMIRALADQVVCMHLGAVLAKGSADQVLSDPAVISSYLGVDDVSINRSGEPSRTPPIAGEAPDDRQPARRGGDMSLVLRGVTIVDPRTGKKTKDRDVLVSGDSIEAVARTGTLTADRVVDATGRFLVPGYVDLHAHPMELKDPSGSLALMLAHGITGFRQMSGSDALLAGARLPADAPAMLARPGDLLTPLNAGTPDKAAAAVRHQHERGADFIKAGLTTAPNFAAAQAEANRVGIPILGHLPSRADVPRISGDGMRSIEHLGGGLGLLACCCSQQSQVETAAAARRDLRVPGLLAPLLAPLFVKVILPKVVVNPTQLLKDPDLDIWKLAVDSFDEQAAADVASMLKANGTWQVPTLIRTTTMQQASDPAFAADPDLRYVDPHALKLWRRAATKHGARSEEQRATMALTTEVMHRLVKIMDDAGVRLLAGSDACGAGWVVPGASLHHEFDELAASGLTPLRVLQMATCDAAEFLGRDDLGSVEAGKSADLVLLGSDPTASVSGLHDVTGVVRAGRFLDETALHALKESVATSRSAA